MNNSKGNLLFVIIFLTIVVARLSVLLVPNVDIVISGFVVHHFWYGALFLIVGLLIRKEKSILSVVVFGIGLGLVVDQIAFMILGAGGDDEYWSLLSIFGVIIISAIIFKMRSNISKLFEYVK